MNVLFSCLSMLNTRNMKIREYPFDEGDTVQGILTNEAPAKATLNHLNRMGQKLDRIVVICSESVREKTKYNMDDKNTSGETLKELLEKMIENEEEGARRKNPDAPMCWKLFGGDENKQPTAYEIYQEMVNCHARSVDASYSSDIFRQIKIADEPKDSAISETVIEAATEITNTDEKVNLYIDYNGGQRYIALMMLTIANLMKNRSVNIERIMTMNSNGLDKNAPIPIQDKNMESIFDCFDLVSGINEYINYGRITALKKYFGKPEIKDKDRDEILDKMEEFANNLQLCRTEYIMNTLEVYNKYKKDPEKYKQKKVLWIMLDEYVKNHSSDKPNSVDDSEEDKDKNSYAFLFYYVVEDILNGYDKMRNGDLPEIIDWCVDHDFIQQALTFCSEEMPGYFWRSGIFRATKVEQDGYDYFLRELTRLRKLRKNNALDSEGIKRISLLNPYYKRIYDPGKNESKYAFEWMISYLPNSRGCEYDYIFENKPKFKSLIFSEKSEKEHRKINKSDNRILKNVGLNKNQISFPRTTIENICESEETKQRVKSKIDDQKKLVEIIVAYYSLKQQRNRTNHADDGAKENNGEPWTYNQICGVLTDLVRVLQDAEKEKK